MKPTTLALISCIPLIACGPTIVPESEGSDDSMGSTSVATPSTAGTMRPMTTVGSTTTAPGDTTLGPEDTGVFDTGEVWLDLPEDCSTSEQDCPRGYKCVPRDYERTGQWNDTECVPLVPDPSGPGEPCMTAGRGIDDCDVTSMCWNIDPRANEGVCTPFCIGPERDPGCADPCQICWFGDVSLCFDTCDPITQDCPPGEACYPIDQRFQCAPDATPPGVGVGSPCEFINACPAGTFCLLSNTVPGCGDVLGCCSPVCSVGAEDPCPRVLPGSECVPWFPDGMEPPGLCAAGEPGACMIPQ